MTGVEAVFKSMCFEMHGLEHEVCAAVNMILELDMIKASIFSLISMSNIDTISLRHFTMRFVSRLSLRTNIESSSVGKRTEK